VLFHFFLQGREYFSCAFLTGPNTGVPVPFVRSWSRIPLCTSDSRQWRDRVPPHALFSEMSCAHSSVCAAPERHAPVRGLTCGSRGVRRPRRQGRVHDRARTPRVPCAHPRHPPQHGVAHPTTRSRLFPVPRDRKYQHKFGGSERRNVITVRDNNESASLVKIL